MGHTLFLQEGFTSNQFIRNDTPVFFDPDVEAETPLDVSCVDDAVFIITAAADDLTRSVEKRSKSGQLLINFGPGRTEVTVAFLGQDSQAAKNKKNIGQQGR